MTDKDTQNTETHNQRLAREELQLLHGHHIPPNISSNPALMKEAELDVMVDTNIVDHPGDELDLLIEGATPEVKPARTTKPESFVEQIKREKEQAALASKNLSA